MLEIGVQSACWYRAEDPDGSLAFIKECGFETIDFNIDMWLPWKMIAEETLTDFFDRSAEELCDYFRPLKEAMAKHGVGMSQMHAPFPVWLKEKPEINEYMIRTTEKTLAVAAYLGCPAVVVHPATRSLKQNEWNTNMEIYRALIPAAKKYGVKICLENLFRNIKNRIFEGVCARAEEACKYIDTLNAEAGEECFGFCFDVGHSTLVGRNIRQYLNTLGKRLTVLHIHDNTGAGDAHMIPYTQVCDDAKYTQTNWDGFIDGLRDIGYEGALSFETFHAVRILPEAVMPEALKLISGIGRYFKARITEVKEDV